LAVFLTVPADAQNLDAGKTPAQIFADTCSACHRRPQELKRSSASFLRSHYTTGREEAAAMASYLAALPADPRGNQQKKRSGSATTPAETPSRREEQKQQAKTQQVPTGTSKGRRSRNPEDEAKAAAPAAVPAAAAPAAAAPATEVSAPETPPPEPAAAPPAPPPPPPLEPFEE
jgi:hypothetical protein